MPRGGVQPLSKFESQLGFPAGFAIRTERENDPRAAYATSAIEWLENDRPVRQNFWPALCIALIAQVDHALTLMGQEDEADIIVESRVVRTRSDGSTVRQLEIDTGPAGTVANRRYYNFADTVIRVEMMRAHPSMPGHATSAWGGYTEFIRLVGQASPGGRALIAKWVWDHGVIPLDQTVIAANRTRQPRVFYEVVKGLDTASGSTGGAMYQALVYAYLVADSPTLTVQSHKVNVGSARAGAIGDVDGYLGEEIVLAAEAKDRHLTLADEDDLNAFMEDVSDFPDADAVVFAASFDSDIRSVLESGGIRTMSREEMLASVSLWDVPKQENALRAMRFFLGRVQQNRHLLSRLLEFVNTILDETSAGQIQIPHG